MLDRSNSYKLLGLDVDANLDDAKQAYHDLIAVWHPDRFESNERLRKNAGRKTKDINEAYAIVIKHIKNNQQEQSTNSTYERPNTENNTSRDHKLNRPIDKKDYKILLLILGIVLFTVIYIIYVNNINKENAAKLVTPADSMMTPAPAPAPAPAPYPATDYNDTLVEIKTPIINKYSESLETIEGIDPIVLSNAIKEWIDSVEVEFQKAKDLAWDNRYSLQVKANGVIFDTKDEKVGALRKFDSIFLRKEINTDYFNWINTVHYKFKKLRNNYNILFEPPTEGDAFWEYADRARKKPTR